MLGLKKFGSKKMLGPKKFWVSKNFGSEKKFWFENVLVPIKFLCLKIFLDGKDVGSQKKVGSQK